MVIEQHVRIIVYKNRSKAGKTISGMHVSKNMCNGFCKTRMNSVQASFSESPGRRRMYLDNMTQSKSHSENLRGRWPGNIPPLRYFYTSSWDRQENVLGHDTFNKQTGWFKVSKKVMDW